MNQIFLQEALNTMDEISRSQRDLGTLEDSWKFVHDQSQADYVDSALKTEREHLTSLCNDLFDLLPDLRDALICQKAEVDAIEREAADYARRAITPKISKSQSEYYRGLWEKAQTALTAAFQTERALAQAVKNIEALQESAAQAVETPSEDEPFAGSLPCYEAPAAIQPEMFVQVAPRGGRVSRRVATEAGIGIAPEFVEKALEIASEMLPGILESENMRLAWVEEEIDEDFPARFERELMKQGLMQAGDRPFRYDWKQGRFEIEVRN